MTAARAKMALERIQTARAELAADVPDMIAITRAILDVLELIHNPTDTLAVDWSPYAHRSSENVR